MPITDRDFIDRYRRDGLVIVRGAFDAAEIARIATATDQLYAEAKAHGRSFRHGNLLYKVQDGAVPMVQWPSYHQPVMNAVRLDERFARILAPLIGGDLKQIINQVHWKARAGGSGGDFAWHQDSRFRLPDEAYRNLGDAYVQTGLAIDPHTPESGCMRFVPGSHRAGNLPLDTEITVLGTAMSDDALIAAGLSPESVVDLVLEPGDFALWSPYLVHASGQNRSNHARRLYINGYVRAKDCDRGEWAFRGGKPVPLGETPALVHYEALRQRPAPHYV